LTPQLEILDALLHHLDLKGQQSRQSLQLKNLLELAVKQLSAIDMQHQYLTEEGARIGDKLEQEMQQYFVSLPITDIQRGCIEAMLEDYRSGINLLAKAARAVHNNLRTTGQHLDQMKTESMA
jgi:hypothetical protein